MRRSSLLLFVPFVAIGLIWTAPALAQQPPLPPPGQPQPYPQQQPPPPQQPPPQYYPPPQQYPQGQYPPPQQYPPGQYPPPQGGYYPPPQQPQYYPPPQPQRQPPPPVEYQEPEVPVHAPKFSLWVGPRLTYTGFGFSFFEDRTPDHNPETTGNFLGNGVVLGGDLGARLAHKYIPYLFYEHGFMGKGHHFEGTGASSSTDFYGIGFRFGGADDVGFISDLSIGKRVVRVSNGGETYELSGLEIFRLGLGAEFRLQTLFTIEAMLTVSGGSMSDTSGTIHYDNNNEPDFKNGDVVRNATTYVVLGLGAGIHFDVFGK